MKKQPTILFVLFILIQSISSAGYFGNHCDKSNRGTTSCQSQSGTNQSSSAGEDTGFHAGTLPFFLFSF
jgi:hypothetical protein